MKSPYHLTDELYFPKITDGFDDSPMAVGGDLSPERLLLGYQSGIFPWYSSFSPILWWSPNPRFIAFPDEVKFSRSMKKIIKQKEFTIKVDCAFGDVICNCSNVKRKDDDGTWITQEMVDAYYELHQLGYAHSFEAWKEGTLVGGLYGVSVGSIFFGESMFSHVSNASKAAFLEMTLFLRKLNFSLIDSQVHTPHLESLGAKEIPRSEFLEIIKQGVTKKSYVGNWSSLYTEKMNGETI